MSGNQLRANAKIRMKVQKNCGNIDISDSEEELDTSKTIIDGIPNAKKQQKNICKRSNSLKRKEYGLII